MEALSSHVFVRLWQGSQQYGQMAFLLVELNHGELEFDEMITKLILC